MQRNALCRSRRELSNTYLLAKFGFDTAENEPLIVCTIELQNDSLIFSPHAVESRARKSVRRGPARKATLPAAF